MPTFTTLKLIFNSDDSLSTDDDLKRKRMRYAVIGLSTVGFIMLSVYLWSKNRGR